MRVTSSQVARLARTAPPARIQKLHEHTALFRCCRRSARGWLFAFLCELTGITLWLTKSSLFPPNAVIATDVRTSLATRPILPGAGFAIFPFPHHHTLRVQACRRPSPVLLQIHAFTDHHASISAPLYLTRRLLILTFRLSLTNVTDVSQMQARAVTLEQAIAALRGSSKETFDGPPQPVAASSPSDQSNEDDDLTHTFGTLDVSDNPTFLGPHAISNVRHMF